MSLVMAYRLAGGDVLFAADKRLVVMDEKGNVVGKSARGQKLFPYSGGVIGIAGRTELTIDIVKRLSPLSGDPADMPFELQEQLRTQYERFTRHMTPECRSEFRVEFVYSHMALDIHIFRSDEAFSPLHVMDFAAIGMTGTAWGTYYTFPIEELNLEQAKRLAVLQIMLSSAANTDFISEEMDMLLLRKKTGKPESVDDIDAIWKKVANFRLGIVRDFYAE